MSKFEAETRVPEHRPARSHHSLSAIAHSRSVVHLDTPFHPREHRDKGLATKPIRVGEQEQVTESENKKHVVVSCIIIFSQFIMNAQRRKGKRKLYECDQASHKKNSAWFKQHVGNLSIYH